MSGTQRLNYIFFDGDCGLCTGLAGFVTRRRGGTGGYELAPLGGDEFKALFGETSRDTLPDSVMVVRADGAGSKVLFEWQAVRRVLLDLGGGWRILGLMMFAIPTFVGNKLYRIAARLRRFWPGSGPGGSCPVPRR